jgi:enamine deaminase RidA (YjgF/YER057c/UK114 family)
MLRDLPIFRKVRQDYLVKPYPASTAVGTPELAIPGLELEIEAVAVL